MIFRNQSTECERRETRFARRPRGPVVAMFRRPTGYAILEVRYSNPILPDRIHRSPFTSCPRCWAKSVSGFSFSLFFFQIIIHAFFKNKFRIVRNVSSFSFLKYIHYRLCLKVTKVNCEFLSARKHFDIY